MFDINSNFLSLLIGNLVELPLEKGDSTFIKVCGSSNREERDKVAEGFRLNFPECLHLGGATPGSDSDH